MKTPCFDPILALVVFTLTFATATMPAQNSWTNLYNGPGNGFDLARAIAVDGNGNVFVTGMSAGNGSDYDYATIKYSNDGVPLWTNRYNGSTNTTGPTYAIALDGNGNVFFTGRSDGGGSDSDYATIKYSNDGMPLWTNRYNSSANGSDKASAIALDGNGNVFVTGQSRAIGSPVEMVTIKYSNDGAPLWTNRNAGVGGVGGLVAVDGDGNVFVTGSVFAGVGIGSPYATIKYSNGGMALWTNLYIEPGNSGNYPVAIAVDGSGSVFVTGYSYNGSDNSYYATIKYSNGGLPLWTNRYNGSGIGYDFPSGMALDGNGNVFVTGESGRSGNDHDYATIKYSNNGMPLWTNRYSRSPTNNNRPQAIAVDGNGNVFVTGAATIKYSNNGLPLWTNLYNGDGESLSIAVDGNGNAFVTGYSWNGSDNDFLTIKYASVPLPPSAALENPKISASEFSFSLTAEPGGQFAIQVSTNLLNWDAIRTVVIPAGGSTNVVQARSPDSIQEFYRVQRQ